MRSKTNRSNPEKAIRDFATKREEKSFQNSNKRQSAFLLLIVFLVSVVLYLPVLKNDFHTWDDDVYVRKNEKVQNGVTFENIVWAFSTNYFGFYYPITWLSHMIDCQFYGLNAKGHYFTNILLHSFNGVLLFIFLLIATKSRVRSFIVSILFVLHPMNVESVAWIAERKNLLSTFFLLLALISYLKKFDKETSAKWKKVFSFFCYLFFVLGLMSKSSIVMFPILLIIIDFWPLKRIEFDFKTIFNQKSHLFELVKEKMLLFVISFIFGVITIVSQKEITAMEPISEVSLWDRIGESLLGYAFYLEKLFLPFNLCVLYPHHKGNYPFFLPIAIFVVISFITTAFFLLSKRKPVLIAGWFFFLISLLPVIGILQTGLQAYADRYVYFPYWGLFIILVYGIDFKASIKKYFYPIYILAVFLCFVAAFLFFVTRKQIETWKDDETLFKNVMKVCPDAFIAPFQLGFVEKSRGNLDKAKYYYERALEISEDYIKRRPKSGRANHDKANALLMLDRYDEAIEYFKKAIEYGFNEKDNQEKIEIAKKMKLKNIVVEGKRLSEEKKWGEAEEKFREAVEISPDSSELWSYLGYIMEQKGNLNEAEKAFEKALEINPLYDTAIYNMAIVEMKKNELDKVEQRMIMLEKLNSPYAAQLKSFFEP